jgi:HAD superfamily hydrolase (TIGR01490 family)
MSIAFFDVDGTLFAKPSLERRFFRELRWRGKIPAANYLRWAGETIRHGLGDLRASAEANKTYLRGVSVEILSARDADGRAKFPGGLPKFFPAAIERVWWHALRADSIVLVSGTLAPLAEIAKFALERELLWRGVEATLSVLATELEISDGRWTGQVAGAAMLGEAKAAAIKRLAGGQGIPLARCSAYGDSWLDRSMLACVGHPCAINPTRRLRRVARSQGWQTLLWTHDPRTLRLAAGPAGERRDLKKALKWTV